MFHECFCGENKETKKKLNSKRGILLFWCYQICLQDSSHCLRANKNITLVVMRALPSYGGITKVIC